MSVYLSRSIFGEMDGPDSSYSCLLIHICWKVEREAKMDPPIQTEYFLSGGAMILIFMVGGARADISFCIRSAIPGNMVVQGEDSLDSDVHCRGIEGLEHDLCHFLSVGLGVEWSFGQQHGVFLGCNTEFVVEGVMPDLLHIVPVGDNSVFDGVLQGQDTSLALSFVSDVRILLSHTDHDTLVMGSSDNGWEDSPWGIISGEPGFAHTGTIVHDQSCYIFISHLGLFVRRSRR